MIIGVPREIKEDEYRVGITPAGVRRLILLGHTLLIEKGAGTGSGIGDDEFLAEGGTIVSSAKEAWDADIVVKVKEPIAREYGYFRDGLILYTFLHLAANIPLTRELVAKGVTAFGYETVQDEKSGALPMLTPMSEVAGRMAVQAGAHYLEKGRGGRGLLLGGVPGVPPGKVVILGAGVVGLNAAKIATGLGARTLCLDVSLEKLRAIDDLFGGRVETAWSDSHNIQNAISEADLVIGAVLLPGSKTPWLVRKGDLNMMREGSVIVDVSVDQGGCVETSRPTSYSDPVFSVSGVTHYCVANMPGAAPRTSTFALCNATLGGLCAIAEKGVASAVQENYSLRMGLNVAKGFITHKRVAEAVGLSYCFPELWT